MKLYDFINNYIYKYYKYSLDETCAYYEPFFLKNNFINEDKKSYLNKNHFAKRLLYYLTGCEEVLNKNGNDTSDDYIQKQIHHPYNHKRNFLKFTNSYDSKKFSEFMKELDIPFETTAIFFNELKNSFDKYNFKEDAVSDDFIEYCTYIFTCLLYEAREEAKNGKPKSPIIKISPYSDNIFPADLISISGDKIENKLDYIKSKRRIVIYGEGGLGKSTFLKKLYSEVSETKEFSHAFLVSLASMAEYSKNAKINTGIGQDRFNHVENNYIFSYISTINQWNKPSDYFNNLITAATRKEEKPVLLLLDGLNEMLDISTEITNTIIGEIQYFSNYPNVCTVITHRSNENIPLQFETVTISGTPYELHKKLLEDNPLLQNVSEIIKIPFYYTLARDKLITAENIKNKFDILDKSYINLFYKDATELTVDVVRKRVGQYFIFASEIANDMISKRVFKMQITDAEKVITKTIGNLKVNDLYYKAFLNKFIRSYDIDDALDEKTILKSLIGNGIIKYENSSKTLVEFLHQDWQDYLAAKSLLINCKLMEACYNDEDDNLSNLIEINANIPETVNNMFLEGLGVTNYNDHVEINNVISQYIPVSSRKTVRPKDFLIRYGYMLTQLVDCAPKNEIREKTTDEQLHVFLKSTFTNCVINADKNYINKLNEIQIDYFLEITARETEYCRRHHFYKDAIQWLNFGKEIVTDSLKLKNQEGKILLHCYQSRIKNIEIADNQNLTEDNKVLFEKGYKIISECAGKHNNMSSNLLGMMLSTPAPYLINENKIKIDYVKAFWLYFDAAYSNRKIYGKDIKYSVRQAVALLIKGYVSCNCSFYVDIDYISDNRVHIVCGNPKKHSITEGGLSLINSLLNTISGENIDFLNYLRGCAKLFEKNESAKKDAYIFFKKDNSILSKIRLIEEYDEEDIDILSDLNKFRQNMEKDPYGLMDKCHSTYLYLDALYLASQYNKKTIILFPDYKEETIIDKKRNN